MAEPAARADALTAVEQEVLIALTGRTVTHSAVTLAADLYGTSPAFAHGDMVGLVAYLVDLLNQRGLVTYRLRHGFSQPSRWHDERPYANLPLEIRLTQAGWVAAGYPLIQPTVGTRAARTRDVARTGDRTDFRNHSETAKGDGPIEVTTFSEHRVKYPAHYHPLMYQIEDTMTMASENRPYTRVTPEMEATVLAAKQVNPTSSYHDLAEVTAVPERTVRYILVDLPRLRRVSSGDKETDGSLKDRIIWVLEGIPKVETAAEMRRILGRADDTHSIVHVLHSLRKQGLVDFDARSHGEPRAITLHKKGSNRKVNGTLTDAELRQQAPVTPVNEAEPLRLDNLDGTTGVEVTDMAQPSMSTRDIARTNRAAEATLTAERGAYPLLDALVTRERDRKTNDQKADAYLRAAEAVEDIDPDEHDRLMDKANHYSQVPFPSPLEAEYLRYMQDNPTGWMATTDRQEPSDG